jgi:hypothetical protein
MGKIFDFPFQKVLANREPLRSELKEEYRCFLNMKILRSDIWGVLCRLNNNNQRAALENLVDRVIQQNECGEGDKEFMVWMGGVFNS